MTPRKPTQLLASEVTIWGAPGDPAHDQSRGWDCLNGGEWVERRCPASQNPSPTPGRSSTLPTSCTGHADLDREGASWPVQTLASEPGEIFTLKAAPQTQPVRSPMQGLLFSPCPAEPQDESAGEPPRRGTPAPASNVDVHVPRKRPLHAGGLAEADVRSTTVTLPEGVQLNPASADGLAACTEQPAGYEGPGVRDPFSPGAPQPLRFSTAPKSCPEASKVGPCDIKTPLLQHALHGSVYLATPRRGKQAATRSTRCSRSTSSPKTPTPASASSSPAKTS